jgi:hypothetical protein
MKKYRYFLAFSSPFVVLYFVDYVLGRRNYDMFSAETIGINFSTGVGLILGGGSRLDKYISHHPGIPLTELSAIFHILFDLPTDNLVSFAIFGMAVNIVTVLGCSLWVSALARQLGSPISVVLISAVLAAMMPGIAAFTPTMTAYHTYGILMVPLGLGIATLAEKKRDHNTLSVTASFFILGFLLSISHLAAIPIVALLVATLGKHPIPSIYSTIQFIKSTASSLFSYHFKSIIVISVVAVLTIIGLTYFYNYETDIFFDIVWLIAERSTRFGLNIVGADGTFSSGLILLAAFFPMLFLAAILVYFSPLLRPILFSPAAKIAVGWIAGVNIYALTWAQSFFESSSDKGGGREILSFADMISQLAILDFIQSSPWHALIPILIIIGIFAVIRSLTGWSDDPNRDRFIGIFIIALVVLNMVLAADISLIEDAEQGFGVDRSYNSSRYYISVIAALPIALVWLYRIAPAAGHMAAVVGLIVFFLSLTEYVKEVLPVSAENYRLNKVVSPLIKSHLANHPKGEVLCYLNYIPDACNTAQAYWLLAVRTRFDSTHNAAVEQIISTRRVRAAWPTVEKTITNNPTLVVSSQPLNPIVGRRSVVLLSWSYPQGKTPMPTYLEVQYLEGIDSND